MNIDAIGFWKKVCCDKPFGFAHVGASTYYRARIWNDRCFIVSLVVVASLLVVFPMAGYAALYNFTGKIYHHNDVVRFVFHLDQDAMDVAVWTDSYHDGNNFDPIVALWHANGDLIAENDDNDTIEGAVQTIFDAGLQFPSLSAGSYIFTVGSYDNFAVGVSLIEGFSFDHDDPIPIQEWWIGGSGYWSVWFAGVDSVTPPPNPIPLPPSLVLLALAATVLKIVGGRG